MNPTTSSLWMVHASSEVPQPLARDAIADVCVVGGGIAGLTTAYLLATEGKTVILLEAKEAVGRGETGLTTAHLAWAIDDRFTHLASVRGDDVARAAAASHRAAVEAIHDITDRESIACDFRWVDGYLFPGHDGVDTITQEAATLRRLGLPFEELDQTPLPGLSGPCLRFPEHGQFHPTKYLDGLAMAFRRHGGILHTHTRVERIEGGTPCIVTTQGGPCVHAKSVVVATNSPFDAGVTLHAKLAAYTTYAVAFSIPSGSVPTALYWDTDDPYHYVRVQSGEESDFLIVGGEDHRTGQAEDQPARWNRLVSWTRERIRAAGPVRHHWSGEVFETPDGLGLIGAAPWGRNLFVITGDSGMGMTHSTLGGRLVANLIQGKSDELADVYSPSRWMPAGALTLLKENLNIAAQYTAWLTGGDVKSAADIPPGQGATIRHGLSKFAVFKDDSGRVCQLSATCPHLGAVVQWNPGERTWDCPAHGSRFDCEGRVIHGPAVQNLERASE
jgi:glycine/D-amino acid oxidase-like deaminating enzyme/nitrite reductase/ring-hydroxylating ferredoxin subunit